MKVPVVVVVDVDVDAYRLEYDSDESLDEVRAYVRTTVFEAAMAGMHPFRSSYVKGMDLKEGAS